MCSNSILQVSRLLGNVATMSDGRIVRLGPTHHISVGDYLEVYADLAIEKVSDSDAKIIQKARAKKKVP